MEKDTLVHYVICLRYCTTYSVSNYIFLDTRSLTNLIRDKGAPKGSIAYSKKGNFNISKLINSTAKWGGLKNLDLCITLVANLI